ncbi:MAG: bifunctional nuclease family protein [Flavobacteriales bacterium]|jgi:bifunctional DNase/RNase|nr:bifunctional nuclease family protein [Flavobacteriales bacterium]MBK6892528.1 bifunctional nuclease family protein [Flavobacteriales bacterium]MBK7246662.1 bifunctional nuclease family protein [Flavobacteriales bacterium]MBK9598623.1 bifunctional nuclease family protein [Flavobacteriales bacterium]QQS72341.1 MAG: bifunctional nuclease family protein [Flavobacteriales bacterium]
MEKVELKFLRITYSHTHAGAYALILSELHGDRRLPIIIGGVEAQAIAIQVENIRPARPLTHDLFKSFCDQLNITVTEVVINDLVEGIFHAKLVLDQNGKTVEIDARSSDAIALALRFQCPIHTYEFILSAAGLKMDEGEEESEPAAAAEAAQETKNIRTASPEDLRQMLQEAIDAEDYEGASKLRDELKRREGTN